MRVLARFGDFRGSLQYCRGFVHPPLLQFDTTEAVQGARVHLIGIDQPGGLVQRRGNARLIFFERPPEVLDAGPRH